MKTEKMTYEKPTVQKVEFDFRTRIAASSCSAPSSRLDWGQSYWFFRNLVEA